MRAQTLLRYDNGVLSPSLSHLHIPLIYLCRELQLALKPLLPLFRPQRCCTPPEVLLCRGWQLNFSIPIRTSCRQQWR